MHIWNQAGARAEEIESPGQYACACTVYPGPACSHFALQLPTPIQKAQELSTVLPAASRAHAHPYKYARPPRPENHRNPPCPTPQNLPNHRAPSPQITAPTPTRLASPLRRRHGVPAEQQPDRDPQLRHLPPLHPDPRRGHLAGPPRRRHRVRALPLGARHRGGGLPPRRLPGGALRRLLPRHLAALGLPPRHVHPHRRALRPHRLRLRRHQQGRRGGRLGPRVQGVQARGLLQLAAEPGGEHQELEQDQELPPGLQGLQEAAGQAGDLHRLHPLRPLAHRVWLLQAPHQLWLHLRQRHGLDQDQHQLDGPGLQHLGQRRQCALLQLPVLQGRRCGHLQAGLEARRRRHDRLPRLHHHRLLHWMLRLQEQPQGQRLQETGRVRLIAWIQYHFGAGHAEALQCSASFRSPAIAVVIYV